MNKAGHGKHRRPARATIDQRIVGAAVADDEVIGMASDIAYLHPDKPLQLFINEVSVSTRFQKRGIGKELVSVLLRHAGKRGCREAWVATEGTRHKVSPHIEGMHLTARFALRR